ncbi:hypothetical protein GALMADRAFT_132623 [Galerina marginata CBS 339.88]|uniref:BTB domain-containing protein n=1 Tax=Galerina marginata (strain CBS 339.88) TaxID=685588 RepID=A0A067TUL9_GALM3|nr:hypothetical protein GALMADRAFT_132623 [Galerina marginata CBS 339.88]
MEAVNVQPSSNSLNTKRKRPKIDDSDKERMEEPRRSAAYWFDDGNVILQAENTRFRVHYTILSRHSQVFQDMFSLPQPEEEALFDGCPLVHVSDAPDDWSNIFSILYDHNVSYASTFDFALPILASMLRIGKKYEFEHLQFLALERIRMELPNSIDGWEHTFGPENPMNGLLVESDYEVDTINVLLETGFLTLLPMAYFLCVSSLMPISICGGHVNVDNQISYLSTESIKTLTVARQAISNAIMSHEFPWTTGFRSQSAIPTAECQTKVKCESRRSMVLAELTPGPSPYGALISPVHSGILHGYCDSCACEIRNIYYAGREVIWDNLPSYFGLPKWEDLRDI